MTTKRYSASQKRETPWYQGSCFVYDPRMPNRPMGWREAPLNYEYYWTYGACDEETKRFSKGLGGKYLWEYKSLGEKLVGTRTFEDVLVPTRPQLYDIYEVTTIDGPVYVGFRSAR